MVCSWVDELLDLVEINRWSCQTADDDQGQDADQIEFVPANDRMIGEEIQMTGDISEAFVGPSDQDERRENSQTRGESIQFAIEPRLSDLIGYPLSSCRM